MYDGLGELGTMAEFRLEKLHWGGVLFYSTWCMYT